MLSLFDILGLPQAFDVNLNALEKAYFSAQRETHPDRLIGKAEKEREQAVLRSQLVNDAYETLKNPLTRAEHLLELRDVFVSDEENTSVPPAVLMEMMELRERIAEVAQDGPGLLAMVEDTKKRAADTTAAIAKAFAANDVGAAAAETVRLRYLGKAAEEAYMLMYRFKAQHSK